MIEQVRQRMEEKIRQREEERREEERKENLIEELGVDFIRESLHIIHNNLKLSVFISDYYIACLKNDTVWFEQNTENVLYSRDFCEMQIRSWRDQIREKYPLMRAYLIITQYRGFHNYRFSKNKFQTGNDREISKPENLLTNSESEAMEDMEIMEDIIWESRENQARSNYEQTKHMIQHKFPKLEKLPSVSVNEVILAEQLFDNNSFAKKNLSETGEIPEELKSLTVLDLMKEAGLEVKGESESSKALVCASPSPTLIADELLNCFDEKYRELLIGNKDKNIPGLPVLGFVTSATPSDEELASAIAKIRENSLELLNGLREEYFVSDDSNDPTGSFKLKDRDFSFDNNLDIFKYFSNRLKTDHDGYANLIEQGYSKDQLMELVGIGQEKYRNRMDIKLYIELGLMVGWAIGCYAVLKSPLARGICELPIGLGANAYFFVIDTSRYEEALKVAFYRADNSRPSYQEISELNDLAFNRMASMLMLPFFTGIPQILKAVK